MKGYPKFLNTKTDYEYVRTHFDKSFWEKDFQALLKTQYMWKITGQLEDEKSGITDDSHRVISMEEEGSEEGTKVTTYWQTEKVVNPNCKLLRLGYTAEEVEAILA